MIFSSSRSLIQDFLGLKNQNMNFRTFQDMWESWTEAAALFKFTKAKQ